MIPDTNGTTAVLDFPNGSKCRLEYRPVVAWDEQGRALIADTSTGRLVPAEDHERFAELRMAPNPATLIPGGGWMVAFADNSVSPVIAWAAMRDGRVVPMVLDDDNEIEPAEFVEPIARIYQRGGAQ